MRPFAFLLILLAPLADLYLLVVIAQHVGGLPVFGFAVASALLGGRLARREGRRVLRDLEDARRAGKAPREGLLSALLLAVAGVLMILPGVVSTLAGVALLVPALRRLVGRVARSWLERRLGAVSGVDIAAMSPDGPGNPAPPRGEPGGGRVIDIDEQGRPIL